MSLHKFHTFAFVKKKLTICYNFTRESLTMYQLNYFYHKKVVFNIFDKTIYKLQIKKIHNVFQLYQSTL